MTRPVRPRGILRPRWLGLGLSLMVACSESARSSSSRQTGSGGSGLPEAGGGPGDDAGGPRARGGAEPDALEAGAAGTAPDAAGGATSGGGLAAVLSAELYAAMFPNRNALYDYAGLLAAAAKYPELATTGSLGERRREVADLLANLAHETTGGWPTAPGGPEAWGLYFTQEVGCESGACTQYCDASNAQYPCRSGKTYHGRGPIQLSWNYNYGAFGAALGIDLLADPDLLTRDGAVAFETALWFWMTPQAPKPSAHAALLGVWEPSDADEAAGRLPGFGMTINIINGGLECGVPTDDRVRDRIRFFEHFVELLGATAGENLECASMQHY